MLESIYARMKDLWLLGSVKVGLDSVLYCQCAQLCHLVVLFVCSRSAARHPEHDDPRVRTIPYRFHRVQHCFLMSSRTFLQTMFSTGKPDSLKNYPLSVCMNRPHNEGTSLVHFPGSTKDQVWRASVDSYVVNRRESVWRAHLQKCTSCSNFLGNFWWPRAWHVASVAQGALNG